MWADACRSASCMRHAGVSLNPVGVTVNCRLSTVEGGRLSNCLQVHSCLRTDRFCCISDVDQTTILFIVVVFSALVVDHDAARLQLFVILPLMLHLEPSLLLVNVHVRVLVRQLVVLLALLVVAMRRLLVLMVARPSHLTHIGHLSM
jgi:hypothetical protein